MRARVTLDGSQSAVGWHRRKAPTSPAPGAGSAQQDGSVTDSGSSSLQFLVGKAIATVLR